MHLPSDVALSWVAPVADEFHARYWAIARSYRYLVLNRPTRSPLAAVLAATAGARTSHRAISPSSPALAPPPLTLLLQLRQ